MILNFFGAVEQILCQPIVTHRAVVAFDIGILLGFAGLDKRQHNALVFRPVRQLAADVFRAVVTANRARFTPPLNDLLQ